MKTFYLLFFFLKASLVMHSQQEGSKVLFRGTITGSTHGWNKLYYYSEHQPTPDSVTIVDGRFEFAVPYRGRYSQLLYTEYDLKTKGYYSPFEVIIDQPGLVTISGLNVERGWISAVIKGNKTAELYQDFLRKKNMIQEQAGAQHLSNRDSIINRRLARLVLQSIQSNPSAFISAYILNGWGKSLLRSSEMELAYSFLSPVVKASEEGRRVEAFVNGLQNASVGKKVAPFILKDSSGQVIDFNSFRGKYVWIDFWTSWCGPCRQSFPRMRELYEKYKEEPFEILGISGDASRAAWLRAVKEVKNHWVQVWNDKTVVDQFAVTAYPTSFLVGPDGTILVKEIGFEPGEKSLIEKELERIFKR